MPQFNRIQQWVIVGTVIMLGGTGTCVPWKSGYIDRGSYMTQDVGYHLIFTAPNGRNTAIDWPRVLISVGIVILIGIVALLLTGQKERLVPKNQSTTPPPVQLSPEEIAKRQQRADDWVKVGAVAAIVTVVCLALIVIIIEKLSPSQKHQWIPPAKQTFK